MRIAAFLLASKIHGENYVRALSKRVSSCLNSYTDIDVFNLVNEEIAGVNYSGYEYAILIHLTGGTSKIAKEIIDSLNRPAMLIAHGKHNSLPSALSVRGWARELSKRVALIYAPSLNSLCRVLNSAYRGLKAVGYLKSLNVLEVNKDGSISNGAKSFTKFFGAKVKAISYRELLKALIDISEEEVSKVVEELGKAIDLPRGVSAELKNSIRVYIALKEAVLSSGANALSIDCFPMIIEYGITPCIAVALLNDLGIPAACENDFNSLPLLSLSPLITGMPGWIANISEVLSSGYIRLSHCTIALKLGFSCLLMKHFETGRPLSISCSLLHRKVLMARFSDNYRALNVYRAIVSSSGLLSSDQCRTQALVRLPSINLSEFMDKASGNHHVVIPWVKGVDESIKTFSWALGIKLNMY